MLSVLIVEDDITFSLMLTTWLGKKGFEVKALSSVSDAKRQIESVSYDLILSDLRLPDGDGIDLLKWVKEKYASLPLIMMTSYAEIQTAVQAIKLGASDYIAKPLNPEELLSKIREVVKTPAVGHTSAKKSPEGNTYIEGQSPAARQLFDHVRLVAPTDMSVLITGASGTGKEYIARRIHEQSNRSKAPFIAVDCGAIPKDLAASEFFGHVKGSFTGAIDNKTGAFVAAHGGTIFLDEIGDMDVNMQVKILRVLQEREVERIGSNKVISLDVRIVAATNQNLEGLIQAGKFRQDLYYRLNVIELDILPLRERREDISLLVHFLMQKMAGEDLDVTPEAMSILYHYDWPGNVRELQNVVEHACILRSSNIITTHELPVHMRPDIQREDVGKEETDNYDLKEMTESLERNLIYEALRKFSNKSEAIKKLGISRSSFYEKIKKYNINIEEMNIE